MAPPRHSLTLLALLTLLVLVPPSAAKSTGSEQREPKSTGSEKREPEGKVLANYVVVEKGLEGESEDPAPPVEARLLFVKRGAVPGKKGGSKRWCGTNHPGSKVAAKLDIQVQRRMAARRGRTPPKTRRLPVYFHNVYYLEGITGATVGKLQLAQIRKQMAVLNAGFSGKLKPQGGAFRDDGTPTGSIQVRFYLAGFTQYQTRGWQHFVFDPDSIYGSLFRITTRRGGCATLNVYTHRSETPGVLGQATFPWDCSWFGGQRIDGVFVDPSTLPGSKAPLFNLGRTLVHETGHWVGLFHTFEGGCDTYNDGVRDTPAETSATFGCLRVSDSCPQRGLDPIRNLMDYGDDRCIWKFTPGQGARAGYYFTAYRTAEIP